MRRSLLFLIPMMLVAASAQAQLMDDFNPPRSNCCLPSSAKTLAERQLDTLQRSQGAAPETAPMLQRLAGTIGKETGGLVLVPTRELSMQVAEAIQLDHLLRL